MVFASAFLGTNEICSCQEAITFGKGFVHLWSTRLGYLLVDNLTARVARPLRRRLLMTFLPLAVFILARNPCVLILFIRLGWYVLFTLDPLS